MSDEQQSEARIKAAWFETGESWRLLGDLTHNPDDYLTAAKAYDECGDKLSVAYAKFCREIAARLMK